MVLKLATCCWYFLLLFFAVDLNPRFSGAFTCGKAMETLGQDVFTGAMETLRLLPVAGLWRL